jgi:sugar lactone lactonase YvrE
VILKAGAALGEGPIWDSSRERLLWVDIHGHALHEFDPATGRDRSFPMGEYVGTVVPWTGGRAVAALTRKAVSVDLDTGEMRTLAELPATVGNVRFNDGKCDPAGRFWVGTMALDGKREAGVLYSLGAELRFEERLKPVSTSNGIAWSLDGRTLYYIDTPTRGADAFDFDPGTGGISRRRRVVTFGAGDGSPDGMTLDEEGMLWIAHWDGGCATRHDPRDGRVLARVDVPSPRVTACWFGGKRLDTLFLTTARTGMSAEDLRKYPEAGHLFVVRPGVRGLPARPFAG